jgi:benzodiazapine receptor
MIYETYMKFSKINKIAGYLFIPYLLWVSFASVLNASIWWLNK